MAENIIDSTMTSSVIEENVSFDDFIQRYEGQAVEWHGGKVVKKVSNNPQHNFIVFFLAQVLSFYLSYKKLGKVLTDGVSMYINDESPARQPDVMVLFNEKLSQITATRVEGAADIVVEVVSPGSSTIGRGIKIEEYEKAGVQEYWLIDPKIKDAAVLALDENGEYRRINDTATLSSHLLPDFTLNTKMLWQDDLPAGLELAKLVEAMLK